VLSEAARAANFTNEGGVDGRVRFLTNVMGLWLISECLRTWSALGHRETLPQLLRVAETLPQAAVFDVQDPRFIPPGDMPARILQWYEEAGIAPPTTRAGLVRAVVESLAQAFAQAVDEAESLSGKRVRVVHVVGGGAHNSLLCQAVADRCGRDVLAGPVEATAIGNVLVQGRSAGALPSDLGELRRLTATTQQISRFEARGLRARMGR
jgi:rhamnulokinase